MNEKLPNFVYIGGIIGLFMLAISVIVFVVYMSLYNQAYDTNVTLTRNNRSVEEKALMITYIVVGSLGFIFSLCIPFGHYLKSFNDPAVVSTKNSLHFETVKPEVQKVETVDIIKPSSYSLVGSRGSDLLGKGTKGFSNDNMESYL